MGGLEMIWTRWKNWYDKKRSMEEMLFFIHKCDFKLVPKAFIEGTLIIKLSGSELPKLWCWIEKTIIWKMIERFARNLLENLAMISCMPHKKKHLFQEYMVIQCDLFQRLFDWVCMTPDYCLNSLWYISSYTWLFVTIPIHLKVPLSIYHVEDKCAYGDLS